MNTMLKKSVAIFATAAILASTSAVTAFAEEAKKEPTGNYDKVVWVGAKDVKAKKDSGDYDTLMKTETYPYVGTYSGGKIAVAVLKKEDAADEAAFVKLFENGKLNQDKAKAAKNLATAKYKDGQITVTAGKAPGSVYVWVYETKKDGKNTIVVNATNLKTGAGKASTESGSATVKPAKEEFTVKAAMTSPQFIVKPASGSVTGITAPTVTDGSVAGTIAKGDKAVNLALKAEAEKATIYIADKTVAASKDNTFTILKEEKTKYDESVITLSSEAKVVWDGEAKAFKLADITAKGAGKTTINIQNDQSGKILKVNVVVTKWAKVTGPDSVKMTVGGEAKAMSSSGTYVAPKTKVSFDKKVKIGSKEYDVGKQVQITADTVVEEVKATQS
ncbi:MAG: hypothetical protein NC084_08390 [Bacteroides sp.]|nr:hypothetical protein [Eubacterium sp.]MCM1418687.1 hypothetical protein [Roseburia sp.]MCM1462715.1 hypothetical protein [Bacteroides sp.]